MSNEGVVRNFGEPRRCRSDSYLLVAWPGHGRSSPTSRPINQIDYTPDTGL